MDDKIFISKLEEFEDGLPVATLMKLRPSSEEESQERVVRRRIFYDTPKEEAAFQANVITPTLNASSQVVID